MLKSISIATFPSGPLATNAYVLSCTETHKAVIIDPGIESAASILPYIDENGLIPEGILLTHTHWDHIGCVLQMKNRYEIPTYVHPEDAQNLENPGSDGLQLFFPIEACTVDNLLEDGQILLIGKLSIRVIHTPGHSPGSVSFYLEEQKVIFSGDVLFRGSIGTLSLPTAEAERMWKSLELLSHFPPEVIVYPGHGDPTTIREESWLPDARRIFG